MIEWIFVAATSLLTALIAVRFVIQSENTRSLATEVLGAESLQNRVYLFDGTDLIGYSHTPELKHKVNDDWSALRRSISDEFPGFPENPAQIEKLGTLNIAPIDTRSTQEVFCEWVDGVTRVELRQARGDDGRTSVRKSADEIQLSAMQNAPYPVWFITPRGEVSWCNTAYIQLAHTIRGEEPELSCPLFPSDGKEESVGKKNRVSVSATETDVKLWFDQFIVQTERGTLCYVIDVNAVVDAEAAKRNFVQALTKTFAQLSIGLAIFDRNRQLALFNPALVDLTSLAPDFLIDRPSVSNFFDRLRNQGVMPEPKNYDGWRLNIDELFELNASSHYEETWSLPSGSVYSVNGRPHPDGAVAFLFEDISAEISLTRRSRAELELVHAVVDRQSEAIVVFAADGTQALSNAAYDALWNVDPDRSFAQITALDATRIWQGNCTATPIWGEIRDFVNSRENRAEWWAQVQLRSGGSLTCSVKPLPNGATMVSFVEAEREKILQV